MSIDVGINNGPRRLEVDRNSSALVTTTGVPPETVDTVLKPFASFLAKEDGTTDMRVNASSAAPQEFFINSSNLGDRFVRALSITISDGGAALNEFGNIGVLTNGCQIIYQNDSLGDVIIGDNLQTNFDFVQLCAFQPSFGTGASAFRAQNVSGNAEAFVPFLDFTRVFGMPYGVRIPKDSTLKLKIVIRDNVSGVNRFDIKAFGFDRIMV